MFVYACMFMCIFLVCANLPDCPHLVPSAPPPQAIDLIDEAGSRVRLRHIQLPEEARDLDKELKQVVKDKDSAVR